MNKVGIAVIVLGALYSLSLSLAINSVVNISEHFFKKTYQELDVSSQSLSLKVTEENNSPIHHQKITEETSKDVSIKSNKQREVASAVKNVRHQSDEKLVISDKQLFSSPQNQGSEESDRFSQNWQKAEDFDVYFLDIADRFQFSDQELEVFMLETFEYDEALLEEENRFVNNEIKFNELESSLTMIHSSYDDWLAETL